MHPGPYNTWRHVGPVVIVGLRGGWGFLMSHEKTLHIFHMPYHTNYTCGSTTSIPQHLHPEPIPLPATGPQGCYAHCWNGHVWTWPSLWLMHLHVHFKSGFFRHLDKTTHSTHRLGQPLHRPAPEAFFVGWCTSWVPTTNFHRPLSIFVHAHACFGPTMTLFIDFSSTLCQPNTFGPPNPHPHPSPSNFPGVFSTTPHLPSILLTVYHI